MTQKNKQPLWTSADMETATHGDATSAFSGTGVSIDSRTLSAGDIFVALEGERFDGHSYVSAAFKAGAAAAVVKHGFVPEDPSWPLLFVDDTTKALESLGRFARKRCKGKIIGVAGSVGKTGTKEMLATLLGAQAKTHASKKSFNNHWGVPLSLANLPADATFGVFEIGMNHAGEITKLTDQVRPHIAIITTIDQEHIEFFPAGLEGIADANAEIFSGMDKNGIVILNHDNPYFDRLKQTAEKQGLKTIFGFGEEEGADALLEDCALHSDGSKITADILGEKIKYKLPIPGKHIVMNSLGALAVIKAAGGKLAQAGESFKNAVPVAGRGNRHYVHIAAGQPPITLIDESYNANPASMAAAFEVLSMVEPQGEGRRIAVLGDMLELGRDGPRLHAELANSLLKARTDLLFCCGPLMDALYQALPPDWRGAHEKDSKLLAEKVVAIAKPGDVFLIKGSAGSKMAYIIEALQTLALPQEKTKDNRNAL
jgi:UDP-N-acetylmuramoyl-tripeptide--D-alanyl-D-alanine ligase